MTTDPMTPPAADDAVFCARHASVETVLRCSRCETPICPRCLVPTPVGARCPDCAQIRKIPTYNMQGSTLVRAVAAAAGAGLAIGFAWAFFNIVTYIFWGVLAGLAIGYAIGEIVSLATGRKAGPPLQAIAVGGVVLAYLVRTGVLMAFSWDLQDLRTDIWGLVVAGIATFVAIGRLR